MNFSKIDQGKEKEKIQITNIRNEKENMTAQPTDVNKITRVQYKQLHNSKCNNLYETGKFPKKCYKPKVTQEEI